MFDTSSYLSGEVRNLAFRKDAERANWQNANKQPRANEIEIRLCKITKHNRLADLLDMILHPISRVKDSYHAAHIKAG
jgi:hypothetical protein